MPNMVNINQMSNTYALVLGISKYDNLKDLPFCKTNGQDIIMLLKSIGYQIPNHYQITEEVNLRDIQQSILNFFADKHISKKDTLIFYYSGQTGLKRRLAVVGMQ